MLDADFLFFFSFRRSLASSIFRRISSTSIAYAYLGALSLSLFQWSQVVLPVSFRVLGGAFVLHQSQLQLQLTSGRQRIKTAYSGYIPTHIIIIDT